ncbi:hypothetical protein F4778DRAFT_336140 [Xylariomycetidae sp. FL2044]|nr:hypothetical protein F4778DRAFT_336140 [Xylariomycetidae sp. FL2044]
MDMLRGGHKHLDSAQSSSALSSADRSSPNRRSRGRNDDEIYLPGSTTIFVTRSRDGRPALGRKRSPSLLRDYGFDMLSEAFSITSRKEFERQSRRCVSTGSSQTPSTMELSDTARRFGTPRKAFGSGGKHGYVGQQWRRMSTGSQTEVPIIHPSTPNRKQGPRTPKDIRRAHEFEDLPPRYTTLTSPRFSPTPSQGNTRRRKLRDSSDDQSDVPPAYMCPSCYPRAPASAPLPPPPPVTPNTASVPPAWYSENNIPASAPAAFPAYCQHCIHGCQATSMVPQLAVSSSEPRPRVNQMPVSSQQQLSFTPTRPPPYPAAPDEFNLPPPPPPPNPSSTF